MKSYSHIKVLIFIFAILSFSSCSNNDYLLSEDGRNISITFRPTLASELNTRAIGDARGIDRLTVVVYEGSHTLSKKFSFSEDWDIANRNGIILTLIEGRSYKILFWADNSENSAYTITEDGRITVDYNNYINDGFAKMEEMDAFFGTSSITVESQKDESNGEIKLSRPLAQLNFADNTTQPVQGTHKAVVTFHSIPTSFNPFTGKIETSVTDKAFVFTDFPTETLSVEGSTYYYVSSNYLFAPTDGTTTVSATIELQQTDGTTINKFEFEEEKAITLKKNMKTNVYGNIVSQPETWSVWDGETITAPTTDEQNRYVIDEASDIAWLAVNGATLNGNTTFLQTKDIDMNSKTIKSIKLPVGTTYDGGEKTIKNFANSLFGDATSLIVKDLTVENITAEGSTHMGTLVNTLKGSSSFTNITVKNSSVATSGGAAGGMVGYIVRTNEKDRDETLEVSFSSCILEDVTVAGSASEGKFVGLLSGYDNKESLSFNAGCAATNVSVADYTSVYTKANNSAWITDDVTDTFDGWLGNETYRRAKVAFAGVRMVPRWDGTTVTAKTDLLLSNGESNKYEVYSPFDLAGVRNATATPTALYLMENVDMNGQGTDGKFFVHEKFTQSKNASTDDNNFNGFSSIALLDGNNYGIYNLALNANGSDRYAFILSGNNGDIHKNTSFHNCCTVVPHIVGTDNGQTVDKSYGAIVVLSVGGATYTMDNVHAYGCKVFALQKTGILAGRIVSTNKATINNCSVNNCYIENYKCQEHKELFEESIVSAEFYSYGEIGSITGFINYNATITNCSVTNTEIHAFGQDDKKGNIANIIKAGTIPGRHVNQFIGDIRSKKGYTVSVSDCSVSGNSYSQDSHSHSKSTSIPIIGEAYCIGAKIIFIGQKGDEKGNVKVKNITDDGNVKFTNETSVTLQELL